MRLDRHRGVDHGR